MFKEQSAMDEAWWVDYVEGEGDPFWRETLSELLDHSEMDRHIVENLKRTRRWVWQSNPTQQIREFAPEGWAKQQHDKIMQAIIIADMEPSPPTWRSFLQKSTKWFKVGEAR